jgi:hypothetical protein
MTRSSLTFGTAIDAIKKGRKVFFSEEKKQKTFVSGAGPAARP